MLLSSINPDGKNPRHRQKNAPGNTGKSKTVVSEVKLSGGSKFPGSRADFRVAVIA
jgi:hypothetical protein